MRKMDRKAAIVCCSNGLSQQRSGQLEKLMEVLKDCGLTPVLSKYIFEKESVFSGTAKERAESLIEFYQDQEVEMIFDISGGDIANEILPWLDYEVIAASDKVFWGYSDLTTILNAIYAKTGKPSVLYQARNLVGTDGARQIRNFKRSMEVIGPEDSAGTVYLEKEIHLNHDNQDTLFTLNAKMLQGEGMQGILVGGNIRCLLKLAGTPYWPDMNGKILLLEAWHGKLPQMTTFLSQLKQMGVFDQIRGILLGTFTQMEEEKISPTMEELVMQYTGAELPVAKTYEIGHGKDAKAIWIGKNIQIK